ncbi:MAG: efflux RND transporter permease subunit, partial [Lachnospiraceae bacterium]|nr:efflux RND transporter permease subunit [Lachnospiraceae bacterium]
MIKFSVKKPFVVLVGIIIVLVLGAVSYSRMTTDLLPHMNLPYMLVLTTYAGASPEKVEADITEPMENQVGTVNGVKNVLSTSSENSSMVYLEFQDDTNMDAAMVKVTSAVNQLDLPDSAGTPMVMEVSMDMMATLMASVDYDQLKGVELSKFIDENIIPTLEREDGVASVNSLGMIEESIEVVLNQDKIDDVNERILEKTNKSLAKARKKIDKAEQKLKDGQSEIDDQKDNLSDQQKKQTSEMAKFTKLMNQALATKAAYESQLASLKASRTALQTEKKAYKDNKIETSYQQMNQGFQAVRETFQKGGAAYQAIYQEVYNQMIVTMVQSAMNTAAPGITVTKENVDTYLQQLGEMGNSLKTAAEEQAHTLTKQQADAQLQTLPESVKDAIDHPEKREAYKKLLEQQGQAEAAKSMSAK